MVWFDFFWTAEIIAHIEEHGLTVQEVEYIVEHPEERETSRTSDNLVAKGVCFNGKYIVVIYDMIDNVTILPVTAFIPGQD